MASLRLAMFNRLSTLKRHSLGSGINRGNWQLFILPVILSVIGLVMIYEASSVKAIGTFGDRLYLFRRQFVWFGLSIAAFFFLSRLNLNLLSKYAVLLFAGNLIFLLLVLIPGIGREVMGGRRWLVLAGINLQPSEMVKITLSLYLASIVSDPRRQMHFIIATVVTCVLVMLQPDMGTTVIIAGTAMVIYFVGGASLKTFTKLFAIGLVIFSLLIITSPYRLARLTTFISPNQDPQGASYHVNQILIALGNGGWFGQGLGMSRQKYLYIPEVTTDSIFAILAEEMGFVGVLAVISLYCSYFYFCLKAIVVSSNDFRRLLGIGLVSSIIIQFIVNLGAIGAILPLTGIPLPYISYGGSALLINYACSAIVYNISKGTS